MGTRARKPFQDPQSFETYNMGHLLTAACVHYRVTGRTNLLAVACKAADFLDRDVSRADAGAGEDGDLPGALHGDGGVVSHNAGAEISGAGEEVFGDAGFGGGRRGRQSGSRAF